MTLPSALIGGNTFAGITFWVLRSGASLPSFPHEEDFSVQHVPYGDTNIIQFGGRKAVTLQLNVMVRAEHWAAFTAKRGQSGTLTLVTGEARTMALTGLTSVQRFQQGFIQAQASFVG